MRASRLEETLKRDFVFVRFGWARRFRRCAGLPTFSGRIGRSSWRPGSEKLHILGHYAQARSLLPSLLVVPSIHLQPTFDENRSAFFQILAGDLRRSSPQGDVDKCDFLAFLAAVSRVRAIDRDTEIAHGAAFGCITDLGVARDVAE